MKKLSLNTSRNKSLSEPLRVGIVSLGCVRNTVDSETILGHASAKGYVLSDHAQADVVIVNTCGFIEAAKKESIAVISDLVELKKTGRVKRIVVAGCLAQRYAEELRQGFPEVDAFVGVLALKKDSRQAPVSLTGAHTSYLKICESCFNKCSFCAIPLIKGRFASRTIESILDDVIRLDSNGVKELNIVGQDVTAYGLDLYGEKALASLLKNIADSAQGIEWIRLLYTYPAHITDALLDIIAQEPKICKYIDIPLQHVSDKILKSMNRNMTRQQTEKLITKIRRRIPGVFLRTTYIVGFPGETEREFGELLHFIKDYPFERVGAFTYSREEGTQAYAFGDRVVAKVKEGRLRRLLDAQEAVVAKFQPTLIGRTLKVLVEDKSGDHFVGRSEFDAPDVDGSVRILNSRSLRIGMFVNVRITGSAGYDLEGVI